MKDKDDEENDDSMQYIEYPKDAIIEKIKKLYANYDIDIADMSEDEFLRIRDQYIKNPKGSLDADLEISRKHRTSDIDE